MLRRNSGTRKRQDIAMMVLLTSSVLLMYLCTASATLGPPPVPSDPVDTERYEKDSKLLSDFVRSDMKILEGMIANKESSPGDGRPAVHHDDVAVPAHKKVPVAKPVLPKVVPFKPLGPPVPMAVPGKLAKKLVLPVKMAGLKLGAKTKLAVPKLKALPLLKKPKVTKLKPIIHVVYKPVPVYHKVPVPKKVIIPKFVPVMKPVPVPKIVPVPYKVPVIKIIPKLVKIPKAVPIPKLVPVKKYIPVGIKVPVPKFYKVPVLKPVPYLKKIPIPIPKPVPKFVPVPVKKIIKVPKPFYVPVKVPHVTKSYIKTPMIVPVPSVKKPVKFGHGGANLFGGKSPMLPNFNQLPHHFGSGKTAFGSMPLLQHMNQRVSGSGKASFETDFPEDLEQVDEHSFDDPSSM